MTLRVWRMAQVLQRRVVGRAKLQPNLRKQPHTSKVNQEWSSINVLQPFVGNCVTFVAFSMAFKWTRGGQC